MRGSPRLAASALVALAVALCGCPRRFDPRAAPLPESRDPAARARFERARVLLADGQTADARAALEQFLVEFPEDPLARPARVLSGEAAYRLGDFAGARDRLAPIAGGEPAEEPWVRRARIGLGLARFRLGEPGAARALLEPQAEALAVDELRGEVHAALAEAAAAEGDLGAALRQLEAYRPLARPAELAWARVRAADWVARLPEGQLAGLYGAFGHDTLAAGLLGARLAAAARARGDEARAVEIEEESDEGRGLAGLTTGPGGELSDGGDVHVVGAVLPLSGRTQPVGEAALRGLLLATGALGAAGSPLQVVVRDSRGDPARAAAAVDELARQAGAIAIVGPPDKAVAIEAAARAEALGVPYLGLVEREALGGGAHVFSVVRAHERRAAALARAALARGARRVAVVARADAYGDRLVRAFSEAAGGAVVRTLRYPPGTTSFAKVLEPLAARDVDAIFVPDDAAALRLIGPHLASLGLWARPRGERPPAGGRAVLLVATGDKLAPGQLLASDGRYLSGAILEPRFFGDAEDPAIGAFVTAFRAAFGRDPSVVYEAFGFDAGRAVRDALQRGGATTRDELRRALLRSPTAGAAGEVAFAADGGRGGDPVLYTVSVDPSGAVAVRALR